MNVEKIRLAWKGCIVPVIVLVLIGAGVRILFIAVTRYELGYTQVVEMAETLVVCILGGVLLTTWHVVMRRHKRIKGVEVRTRIKSYWKFFMGVYLVYVLIVLADLSSDLMVLVMGGCILGGWYTIRHFHKGAESEKKTILGSQQLKFLIAVYLVYSAITLSGIVLGRVFM